MDGSLAARSPSFNSYSNTELVKIADRVVGELACDVFCFEADSEGGESERGKEIIEEEDTEREFEFGIVARDSAIFRQIYPVFGRNLLTERVGAGEGFPTGNGSEKSDQDKPPRAIRRHPLRKLFIDERETTMTSSCSSSEADDLDGVPAGTYCVWRPKESAVARCKKSSSTGAHHKGWRLKVRELLQRSHSDVSEDGVVFIREKTKGGAGEPP